MMRDDTERSITHEQLMDAVAEGLARGWITVPISNEAEAPNAEDNTPADPTPEVPRADA
jgi:hypothetical protein